METSRKRCETDPTPCITEEKRTVVVKGPREDTGIPENTGTTPTSTSTVITTFEKSLGEMSGEGT